MNLNLLRKIAFLTLFLIATSASANIYECIDEGGILNLSDSATNDCYTLALLDESSAINLRQETFPEAIYTQQKLLAFIAQSALKNQLETELLHAVIHVESGFRSKAVSRKGAQGLMQLIPATASRFGVSNVFDAAENIEGGAKYLRELLNLFNNDVSLALAAYNAGENAVIKYGYRIPPYKETQQYVPKVLNTYKALLKQRKQVI